jgi:hypothetical protein
VEADGSAIPLPIDRARDAKYRNIAAGQGKAPTLKCRAFFPDPHPTRNAVYAKTKTIHLFPRDEELYLITNVNTKFFTAFEIFYFRSNKARKSNVYV